MNAILMKKVAVVKNQSAQYAPLNARRKGSLIDVCLMYSDCELDDSLQPL